MSIQAANDRVQDLPGEWSRPNGVVLLAEDDPDMRKLVAATLREEGLNVVECANGTELLMTARGEWLAHERPLCVITDVRMPGCSGLQAAKDLRFLGWRTPILMVTGFGDEALRRSAHDLGASVLDKPFALSELRAFARRLVT
jgi:DNA-binding response OmpR family regulator